VQNQTSPLILCFGVSDPVGAIGIQADLATFSAMGCHGLSVTTALLICDSARIEATQDIEPGWVSDQARVLLEDMEIAAIKIGALGGIEHVTSIAEIVSDYPDVPLILDPFISSLPEQGQDSLDLLMALRQLLIPQATLLMLSRVELARLAETWRDDGEDGSEEDNSNDSVDTLQDDVTHLIDLGCEFVLVTGTPAQSDNANGIKASANTLFGSEGIVRHDSWQHLVGPFVGAGSTLSAAIAALMARGMEAGDAVLAAQQYTAGTLLHAQRFGMGKLVPNRFFLWHADTDDGDDADTDDDADIDDIDDADDAEAPH
jgi:hydroxymethylpyrimidine/phosphomethylpyrimidine kinase